MWVEGKRIQMGIPMGFDSPYPDIVALFQETVSKRNRREGISTVEIETSKALGCGFKSRPFLTGGKDGRDYERTEFKAQFNS